MKEQILNLLAALWALVNTPAGIAVLATGLLALLNRIYAKKPAWRAYEGTIIGAVKAAEKAIPDGTASAGAKRLDAALKLALEVYAKAEGRRADAEVEASLREGIQIVHADLETKGAL